MAGPRLRARGRPARARLRAEPGVERDGGARRAGVGRARLRAEGDVSGDVEVRGDAGRVFRRLDVSAGGFAPDALPVVALRPALHRVLFAERPRPGFARARQRSRRLRQIAPSGVILRLKGGSSAAGDVLIGADGIGSAVRRVLRPHAGPPRRSGYYTIRGVAHDVGNLLGDLQRRQPIWQPASKRPRVTTPARAPSTGICTARRRRLATGARDAKAIVERSGDSRRGIRRLIARATAPEIVRLNGSSIAIRSAGLGIGPGDAPGGRGACRCCRTRVRRRHRRWKSGWRWASRYGAGGDHAGGAAQIRTCQLRRAPRDSSSSVAVSCG